MTSETQRTVQPEDLFQLQFLQDAKLSPSGKQVAYCISHVDTARDEEYCAIWILSPQTGEARQLTDGLAVDSNPVWSPDERQIAFFSNRSGVKQLHTISVDGGEMRMLTDLPQGVGRGPAWSPDGEHIAFSARATSEPVFPTKPYRVTRKIYRLDAMGYLHNAVHDIFVVPAAGGEARNLTRDENHNCRYTAPEWSPDSREILFTTTFFPDEYRFFAALRVANLNGEVRDLVREWGYASYSAVWSPDGSSVIFVGNRIEAPFSAQNHLWVVDRKAGTPECRTTGLVGNVEGPLQADMPVGYRDYPKFQVADDGRNAYVRIQDGGKMQVYRVALQGDIDCEMVVGGDRACYPIGLHDGRLLISTSNLNVPPNLYQVDMDGDSERQLTHFNAELLASVAQPETVRLSCTSSDGVPVEGWLMKPPGGAPPYPTILYIHGGPHHGWGHIFSFDFQMLAGAGYAVLLVNYRGSTGYGDSFSNATNGPHHMELEYADLMAAVDHAIAEGLADPDRMGVCGLSYGGCLSCWIITHTDRFKAAVPENPVTNRASWYGVSDMGPTHPESIGGHLFEVPEAYRRVSSITYAHRCTTPTLLIQGEKDLRVPAEQSEQFYTVLRANGCTVEMLRLPESPHSASIGGPLEIRRAQNEALLDWMIRYVPVAG